MKNRISILFLLIFLISNTRFSFSAETKENLLKDEIIQNEIKIKDVNDRNKANIVIIQALNKITAKTYKYEIKIGDSISFERLIVTPLFCWKSSPEEILENKALIKIVENKLNKTKDTIFYGWMFSSSPGLSSLEHSMYDITLIDCKN